MPSLPNLQTRSWATAALLFLVALPLIALVTAVFVAALRAPLEARKTTALVASQPSAGLRPVAEAGPRTLPPAEEDQPGISAAKKEEEPTLVPQGEKREREVQQRSTPAPPWQAALDLAIEAPGYGKLAFQSFEEAFGQSRRDDLTPWLAATDSAGFRITKVPSQYGQSGMVEGIGRLLCPWPAGAVLRLQLENFDGLKLHFWNGLSGLTLVYQDEGNRWAVYKTTREGDGPTPNTWAIAATDDDRCRRSGFRYGGPLEFRFVDGEFLLSRGDVVLLAAPFDGRPTAVFVDGRATIHGIALARTKDAPTQYRSKSAENVVSNQYQPADLEWKTQAGVSPKLERLADGAIRFGSEPNDCFARLPEAGLQEVVLELAEIGRGAGIFLTGASGRPHAVLRFCGDRKTGRLLAALRESDQPSDIESQPLDQAAAPLVEAHCWVKLVSGCGNLRWWLSTDGVHWAQTEPAKDMPALLSSLGLSIAADAPNSQLTVKRIELRQLAGLRSLAKCDPDAFEEFATGPPRDLAYHLLERLLDAAHAQGVPFADQLAALDDAALLCRDLRDNAAMKVGVLSRYPQLGLWAADYENLPAWSCVRRAFHSVSICSPLQSAPDLSRVVRWELITRAYQKDFEGITDFVPRLRLFQEQRATGLVDWAQWAASSAAGSRLAIQPKDAWRELLVEDISKDAYNAMTELKAVLDGESWDEAARLIAALRPEKTRGIAPAIGDDALLTSLPGAIADVFADFPHVAELMPASAAATAQLRIAEAIRSGDVVSLELAAVQFAALPAAADAHRWLADRALTAGRFAEAIKRYEQAIRLMPERKEELAPKLDLAAAMSGRKRGDAIPTAAEFGGEKLSSIDFDSLINELRTKHAGDSDQTVTTTGKVPQPGSYRAEMRNRFDGPSGERSHEEAAKPPSEYRVPWVDRQLAIAVHEGTLYVTNRFCVAAFDLADGRRLWQTKALPQPMQRAQDWPLIPMRLLVHGDRVFVRLLYSANPILACFDRSNGELIWTTATAEREALVSDPLWIDDRLVLFALSNGTDQAATLQQLHIDSQAGEILQRRDLIRLRGHWWSRRCCQVTAVESGLIATLGGVTLSTTSSGELRWIRKHIVVPADEDARWMLQSYEAPLVAGDWLFIEQPGVRALECVDVATGRRRWQTVLPEMQTMIGLAGDLLVVRTERDVRGIDAASGATRWRFDAADVTGFPICDEKTVLLTTTATVNGSTERQIRLLWLNASSGETIASSAVEGLLDADPQVGRVIGSAETAFVFLGRGRNDLARTLYQLSATPPDTAKTVASRSGN